ncbi:MAG: Ppx/GppA phosphatase family protein [Actinobacteria bacterium]|nr:Ppx/GppA phosphatase family protein [Actinomycetota bacterium]
MPQTTGFIDIGTNSVRLMVVRLEPDHSWSTITLQKEPVRLGEGEFGAQSTLQPAAMDRAALVCRSFAELARSHGAQMVVAVATSATREAGNKIAFVRRLREEAGLDVHVVSGQEEARLIFLGVLSRVHLGARRALVIDIGGGSTEVALGDRAGAAYMDSLRLGAIRLSSEFPEASAGAPVTARTYEAMRRRVQVEAARIRRHLAGERIDVVFGTSGTIRNLASVVVRALRDGAPQRVDTLSRAEVRKVAKMLRSLDLEERRAVPGLNPLRADIVVAGTAILDALMEDLDLAEIQAVAECGLREGLVVDHLARSAHELSPGAPTVRERSVLQLARACAFDEPHARHVTGLALELFDSAGDAGLHRYGDGQRELFGHAALLHDIGSFLSYSDHHLHSYYLIRHADLLGFDENEIATMAATALFHRKARPGTRHPAFAGLDRTTRKAVRLLSVLLRLAEYMDRGHTGAVAHAALRADGPNALMLEVRPAKDWHLERWRLENRREAVEKALGRALTVQALEP